MKHFGVNRAILVGNWKLSKCCSEGSQLIRSEISIKLAKVSKICQNTPLLPSPRGYGLNSRFLRHFDLSSSGSRPYNSQSVRTVPHPGKISPPRYQTALKAENSRKP